MTDEALTTLYQSYRNYKNYTTPSLKPKHAARFEREFWQPLNCRPDMSVLEIGCGTGIFLAYLASKGFHDFLGIDHDPALAEFISPQVASHFRAVDVWDYLAEIEGGNNGAAPTSGRFDRVVMFDVLEHFSVTDGLRLLTSLRPLLKPGGLILIKVPNTASPWGAQFQYGDLTHLTAYTPTNLRQLAIAAGYSWVGARPHLMGSPVRQVLDRLLHALLNQVLMAPPELWSPNFFGIIGRDGLPLDAQIRTIMVYVGVDLVGDSLMKLPFLRALRSGFPNAHITWVAGQDTSVFASVMKPIANGLIDEVIERANLGRAPSELLHRPMGAMKGRSFDLIIDTQKTLLTTLVLKKIPHRQFISGSAKFLLSDHRPRWGYRPPSHMVCRMLDLLQLAIGRTLPTPDTIHVDLDPALTQAAQELLPPGPVYVGLAPGAGGRHKCWPVENFIAIAQTQTLRGRTPVFLIGPQERDWEKLLRSEIPAAQFPLQTPGVAEKFGGSPLLTIALGQNLQAVVCNDSGLGHMMAVSDTALVSLFGPTSPDKFKPLSRKLTLLTAQTWGGRDMGLIPIDAVATALDNALR